MLDVLEDFRGRDLVFDMTEGLPAHLAAGSTTLYAGFDPTASSLHIGSMMPILALARFQRHGHSPIAVVGGGTGLIGDPSGKSQERQLLSKAQLAENIAGIREQLGRFLDFDSRTCPARLVDNADWLTTTSVTDTLRDVGKHFTVNYMLAKESIQRRLSQEEGISFTEFSYLLLQAWDFLTLFDRYGCTLQVGGSDQWGNITAGVELIRRARGAKAHGLVSPLLMTASGTKFGKTEAGAVWLDAERTSPYRLYQFWLNSSDQDVTRYLRYFTWLSAAEIEELAAATEANPAGRAAQQRLAREVTTMVHGETAAARAERSSAVLFGGELSGLGAAEILEIFDDVPSSQLARDAFGSEGLPLVSLLVESGLTPSKGAARRLIRDGGAYVNNQRIADERASIGPDSLLDGQLLILRKGQKSYHLMTVNGD